MYLYVPILGQSNAARMSVFDGDDYSGQSVLETKLRLLSQSANVQVSNYAVGGSAVDGDRYDQDDSPELVWWYPDSNTPGMAMNQAISGMLADLAALPAGEPKNVQIFWSQGETDARIIGEGLTTAERYMNATREVFDYIKAQLAPYAANIEFFLSKTGRYEPAASDSPNEVATRSAGHPVVRDAQDQLDALYDDIHIVFDAGDPSIVMKDHLHYVSEAYELIGNAAANAIAIDQGLWDGDYDHLALVLNGTAGNDRLAGLYFNETILGLAGDDSLMGGDGNDTLDGGAGRDKYTGGAGEDVFRLSHIADSHRTGGNYSDRITDFTIGEDLLDLRGLGFHHLTTHSSTAEGELRMKYSASSNRTYLQSDQNDFYLALDGDFRLTLSDSDFIFQEEQSDLPGFNILGTSAADTLTGTEYNDTIDGSFGADLIYGLAGRDSIVGGTKNDTIFGGDGNDTIDGGYDPDSLYGGNHDDLIYGGSSGDLLSGDAGADTLFGGADGDTLLGGDGNDVLDGGAAKDYLTGGIGSDIFCFSNLSDSLKIAIKTDVITDFQDGIDHIKVAGLGFNHFTMAATTTANELHAVYNSAANQTLVFNDQVDFCFALQGDFHLALSDADFIFS